MIRLKELREKLGLEQKNLAMDLQVSQPTISEWESGKKLPSTENIIRLADYFNVSIDYLINHKEEDTKKMDFANEFISRFAKALSIDVNSFSKMVAEMSVEDIKLFLTPSDCVPADTNLRLKRARFSAGLCQSDIARELGISYKEYSEYESGNRSVSSEVVKTVSQLFGVNADWLKCTMEYIDPMTNKNFNPEEYKPFVDSVFDSIDIKNVLTEFYIPEVPEEFKKYANDSLKLLLKVEVHEQQAVFNMLSNYLKLSVRSQGKIDGQIEELLKTEQYSAQEGLKNA